MLYCILLNLINYSLDQKLLDFSIDKVDQKLVKKWRRDVVKFNPNDKRAWSVTITVNNIEPCGAVICDFWDGNCYNIDFREYNP